MSKYTASDRKLQAPKNTVTQDTSFSTNGNSDTGIQQLRWLAERGVTFTLPRGRTKGNLEEGWPNQPHTVEEAITHANRQGNVGILTGKHSQNIIALDLDVSFPVIRERLGSLGQTAGVTRSNVQDRGKLLFRIDGELPPSSAWTPAGASSPHAELLANGKQAIGPTSQFDGGYYLLDTTYDILVLKPEQIENIWQSITDAQLYRRPVPRTGDVVKRAEVTDPFVSRVRDAWPTLHIFEHFGWANAGQVGEQNFETRILGNGGLLVKPNHVWYQHSTRTGGDNFDAWAYCRWGFTIQGDKERFKDTLNEMAKEAGIEREAAEVTARLTQDDIIERMAEIKKGIEGTPLGDAIACLLSAEKRELGHLLKARYQWEINAAKALFARCEAALKKRKVAEQGAGRPMIETEDQPLDLMQFQAITALRRANKATPEYPMIYSTANGQVLARVVPDEDSGATTMHLLELNGMANVLAKAALWTRGGLPTVPPAVVATAVYSEKGWGFPALEGVVHYPTFDANGNLCMRSGYNPETKLFYAGSVTLGNTEPTQERIAWAKSLILDDLLVDFPYAEQASRAHAVAALLQPYLMPLIHDVTPVYVHDAPKEGTGKTKHALLGSLIAEGSPALPTAVPTDEDELRKRVATSLADGGRFIVLDNLPNGQALNSGALSSFLTAYDSKERRLQHSEEMILHNRAVWHATGNNITASGELVRRITWIRLDANVMHPSQRQGFRHTHLEAWITKNRAELMTACIVLCKAWVKEGMPMWEERAKGSYERWAGVMGGILKAVGIEGFLENTEQLQETANAGENNFEVFVLAWAERFGTDPVTASDLYPLASRRDNDSTLMQGMISSSGGGAAKPVEYLNLLGEYFTSPKEDGRRKALGNLLAARRGQVFGVYKIIPLGQSRGSSRYRLEVAKPKK